MYATFHQNIPCVSRVMSIFTNLDQTDSPIVGPAIYPLSDDFTHIQANQRVKQNTVDSKMHNNKTIQFFIETGK